MFLTPKGTVDLNDFKEISLLSSETDLSIYITEDTITNHQYLQTIYKKKYESKEDQKIFYHEILRLSNVSQHPFLINIVGLSFFDYNNKPFPTVFHDYLPNRTLTNLLANHPIFNEFQPITPTKKFVILLGIARGMNHLHKNFLAHGNLDTDRIYLDSNLHPKIFGFKKTQESNASTAKQDDIFNFGLIAFELITNKKLNETIKPSDTSLLQTDWQRTFLTKIMSKYRWYRPDFDQIVNDLLQHSSEFGDVDADEIGRVERMTMRYMKWYCQLVEEEAEKGSLTDMFLYGTILSDGDFVETDKKEALKYFKKSADLGNVHSMFSYAFMLSKGDGIQANKREAAEYYKKAIDKGNRTAMFNYGHMLFNGDGIQADKKEAAKFYKLAADQGNVKAMFNYAILLAKGDGVQMNKKEAAKYFKLAADSGNLKAMTYYASMMLKGDGVYLNKNEAALYYKEAADNMQVDAMMKYAMMLETGDGIQPDKNEAIKYFKMAADLGNKEALENYKRLK